MRQDIKHRYWVKRHHLLLFAAGAMLSCGCTAAYDEARRQDDGLKSGTEGGSEYAVLLDGYALPQEPSPQGGPQSLQLVRGMGVRVGRCAVLTLGTLFSDLARGSAADAADPFAGSASAATPILTSFRVHVPGGVEGEDASEGTQQVSLSREVFFHPSLSGRAATGTPEGVTKSWVQSESAAVDLAVVRTTAALGPIATPSPAIEDATVGTPLSTLQASHVTINGRTSVTPEWLDPAVTPSLEDAGQLSSLVHLPEQAVRPTTDSRFVAIQTDAVETVDRGGPIACVNAAGEESICGLLWHGGMDSAGTGTHALVLQLDSDTIGWINEVASHIDSSCADSNLVAAESPSAAPIYPGSIFASYEGPFQDASGALVYSRSALARPQSSASSVSQELPPLFGAFGAYRGRLGAPTSELISCPTADGGSATVQMVEKYRLEWRPLEGTVSQTARTGAMASNPCDGMP